MGDHLSAIVVAAGLLVGMLLGLEIGRIIGRRPSIDDPEGSKLGISVVDSAVFALFGLLLAFTFSGAAERFSARQHLIVDEANYIGTAWMRLDLLPPETQPGLRDLFRKYLDSRLETYRKVPDMVAVRAEMENSTKLQKEIWTQSILACNSKKDAATTSLLLSSLNEMIDITTTRTMATKMHPPTVIFILLFGLSLGCAVLAGHGMAQSKERSWIHIFGFAIALSVSIYVILDLEYPRVGFIRVDHFDEVLVELRKSME